MLVPAPSGAGTYPALLARAADANFATGSDDETATLGGAPCEILLAENRLDPFQQSAPAGVTQPSQ